MSSIPTAMTASQTPSFWDAMDKEARFVIVSRLMVLAALLLGLSLVSEHFFTTGNLTVVLRQAALQFLIASGLTIVVLTGGIDLSIGAVLGLSACVGASIVAKGELMLGVTAALATGLACGVVNGLCVTYARIPSFIATYGMLWIAHGLAYVFMKGEVIHGFPQALRFAGAGFAFGVPMPVLIGLGVLCVLAVMLKHTRFGQCIYAIGGSAEATRLCGVPVQRRLIGAYGMSGFLAAVAGLIVMARTNAADSGMGEELLLPAIAAVCLGGTSLMGGHGGIAGTAVGALILVLIINGMNLLHVSTFWQSLVMGVLVILAVLADMLMGGQSAKRKSQ